MKISKSKRGCIISNETKLKLSLVNKGKNNPMFGKHLSDKTKLKISLANKGRHHTEEAKRKISLSAIGKPKSIEHKKKLSNSLKGRVAWNKGIKWSKEIRKKISEKNKGRKSWNIGIPRTSIEKEKISRNHCDCKGIKNANYIDGRSFEPYSIEWTKELKEQIHKRDNYTCQNCNITEEEHLIVFGRSLPVHRIDYNKKNCKENNLITLCASCNARANHNREEHIRYFKEIICH